MPKQTRTASPEPTPSDAALLPSDLGQLAFLVGQAANAQVQRALAAKGLGDVRSSHAALIQQLAFGACQVGALALRLGVSQQAASKSVGELEALGYVARSAGEDKRVSQVSLTTRGREVVQATRKVRQALEKKLAQTHGERALGQARTTLAAILESMGGSDASRERPARASR